MPVSPGMALLEARAPTPQISIPGGPIRAERQRGLGTSCSPGMSPALGPRSQGSGFPVPRQPEPGMAFQAGIPAPPGLGARGGWGRGRQGGHSLPGAQAGAGSEAGERGWKVRQHWEMGAGRTPKGGAGVGNALPKASPQTPRGQCPCQWHHQHAWGVRGDKGAMRDARGL